MSGFHAVDDGSRRTARSERRRLWGIVSVGAVVISLLYALQTVSMNVARDLPPDVARVIGLQLLPWLGWIALFPAIFAIATRWPLADGASRRNWWRHALVALAAPPLHALLILAPVGWLRGWWADELALGVAYTYVFANGAVGTLAQYALVATVCHAYIAARAAQQEALTAARLNAALADAELRALRAQLQPHFLFNTLNAISAHVRDDPDIAEEMIDRLGTLLRLVLQGAGEQEVTLRRELDMAEHYLAIHEVRFGGRLTVDFRIDPSLDRAMVPSMLLQPLVENAIQHGAAAHPGAARVRVSARPDGRMLQLLVENDRAPVAVRRDDARRGIGLANTRARLRQLYGDACDLRVELTDAIGAVRVSLPLRMEGAA